MAKTVPFYEQQISPSALGGYSGPSQSQIVSTFQPEPNAAVAFLQGAVAGLGKIGEAFMQRQQQIQDAYDSAQLAKAKAGYYAAMKSFSEQLPYGGTDPIKYQEVLSKESEKYFNQAQKILENTSGGYLLGGPNQRTVRDDFESWRTEQDATFSSSIFQSQRAKMTDLAVGQIKDALTMVRNDPTYLPQFTADMKRYMDQNVVNREYGVTLIEQATSIADISTYYNQAKSLGIEAGVAWLSDASNTPKLDDTERGQLQRDFGIWSGQIQAAAERVKNEQVQKSNDKFFEWFFLGVADEKGRMHFLTNQDINTDAGTEIDANAPTGSQRALQLRENYASMIRARDSGSSATDIPTDPTLYTYLIQTINNRETTRGEAENLLNNALIPVNGVFRLNPKDYKVLWSYVQDEKKSLALDKAIQNINTGASATGALYNYGEGTLAIADLSKLYFDKLEASKKGVGKEMSEEEIAGWEKSFFEGMANRASAKGLPGRPAKNLESLVDYKEALKTGWYEQSKKMNPKGVKNFEAYIKMAASGQLVGILGEPEWSLAREQAKELTIKWFNEWAKDPNGVVPQYTTHDWNGMTVLDVARMVGGVNVRQFYTIVPDLRDPKNPHIMFALIDAHVKTDGTYASVPYPGFIETWPDMISERAKLEKAREEELIRARAAYDAMPYAWKKVHKRP